jgi:hypothetical protein
MFARSFCGRDLVNILIALVFLSFFSGVAYVFDRSNAYPVFIFSGLFIIALCFVKRFSLRNKIMIVEDLILVPGVALFTESRIHDEAYKRDMMSIDSKTGIASVNFRKKNIQSVDVVLASTTDLSFWKRVRFVEGNPRLILRISFKQPLERLMAPEGSPLRVLSEISWKHHPTDPKEIYVSVRDPESARRALVAPPSNQSVPVQ